MSKIISGTLGSRGTRCHECDGSGISYWGTGGSDHMNAHSCKRCNGNGVITVHRAAELKKLEDRKAKRKWGLPIPSFLSAKEVVTHHDSRGEYKKFVMIAPDHNSGSRNKYSVISINAKTGKATCIGRELPLKQSREIANRK